MNALFFTLVVVLNLALPHSCLSTVKSPLKRDRRDSERIIRMSERWNATKVDQLKKRLLLNYDRLTRPSLSGNATVVLLDPEISHVELDEARGVLAIHCWVKMTWNDEILKWDSQEEGVSELHVASQDVWQPDIVPYNSATWNDIDHFGDTQAIVWSTGKVLWVPPAIIEVFCDVDLAKWPFDTQECMLKVGSWTYDVTQIDLNYNEKMPNLSNLLQTAEWKLISIRRERNARTYPCCAEQYADIAYYITLKRNSSTYKAIVVSPVIAIVLMTMATLWLPSNSVTRISLGGITLLIICLYLLYFSQKVAITAGNTPLLVLFYVHSLYIAGFALALSVLVINFASSPRNVALPRIIKSQLRGCAGRLLLLPISQISAGHRSKPQVNSSDKQESPEGQDNIGERNILSDWYLLAVAIDRIAFVLYCLLFISFTVAYSGSDN